MIKPGLRAESASHPNPHFSIAPGRKFSTTMSAPAASLRTISCASARFRSSVTDFLFRACAYHHSEVPSCSLRHFRNGSPVCGGSILITSAPNSASRRAQNGPAISVPNSITLTPCRGPRFASLMTAILTADIGSYTDRNPLPLAPARPWLRRKTILCGMRRTCSALAMLFLAGCAAVQPQPDAMRALERFETLATDERVRYEPGARHYAERVAELLPAAIGQVEAGHYRSFRAPVIVHVCGTSACFEDGVPGGARFTAAVIYDNRLLLAPRLFDREPARLYPILVHELSYLHLGQQLGHYTMRIPVWFHEGLASLVASSGGADLVSEDEARNAIAAGQHFLPH